MRASRAVLVLRPGSTTEVWALVVDHRRSEGIDERPALSRRHDLILHSSPTGGRTLRIAAAHPHIVRTVYSDGGNLHGSIATPREQLREAAGNCCVAVPTYQATFLTRTLLPRIARLSDEGRTSLELWLTG